MKKIILSFCLVFVTLLAITSCTHNSPHHSPKTFVLIHGAWQAPYVWNDVKAQLTAEGQNVVVVELPAHGDDNTSPALVSIDAYRDKVIAAINAIQGKVILVGHSMGGVVVSAVAESIPQKIEKLVFIGAFVPANGQSLLDLALQDSQSSLGPNLIPSDDQLTLDVVHDSIVSIFCQDAPLQSQQLVLQNYRPEPAIPFTNPLTLTATNFGSVDKYYVRTLQDHAIGYNLQSEMIAAANISNIYSINTGHSPFLSKPTEVTNILLAIAAR